MAKTHKPTEFDASFYITQKEVMDLLRVSRATVDNYVRAGHIRKYKNIARKVLYSKEDVYRMLNIKVNDAGMNVMYTRVSKSTHIDKLKEQQSVISGFTLKNGIKIDKTYQDVCRSYDFKHSSRSGLYSLLKEITMHNVKNVFILSPDRITRFGHEIFDQICKFFQVNVIYLSEEISDEHYNNEIKNELLDIIRSIKKIHNL